MRGRCQLARASEADLKCRLKPFFIGLEPTTVRSDDESDGLVFSESAVSATGRLVVLADGVGGDCDLDRRAYMKVEASITPCRILPMLSLWLPKLRRRVTLLSGAAATIRGGGA